MAWAAEWSATIVHLYTLNAQRFAVLAEPQAFATAQAALEQAIAAVAQQVAARTAIGPASWPA